MQRKTVESYNAAVEMDELDLVVEHEQSAEVHYLNLVVVGYLLDDAGYCASNVVLK